MKTKILMIVAILLAVPTYGISLLIWLFAKYKYDKFAATRVLINAAVMSYNNNGQNEVRYGVNNAALPIVFKHFGGQIVYSKGNSISGVLPHPLNGNLMILTMSQISGNRLLIKATRLQS